MSSRDIDAATPARLQVFVNLPSPGRPGVGDRTRGPVMPAQLLRPHEQPTATERTALNPRRRSWLPDVKPY
jgi:hypothetical protein